MAYCNLSHYTPYHLVIFILTFFSYACLHATRKAFSNVKPTIEDEWTSEYHNATIPPLYPKDLWEKRHVFTSSNGAETFLGILDMIFMFSYAIGLFISGHFGDKLNHRWVLSGGMMISAIIVFIFGVVTEWLHFYNPTFYVIFWILNGLAQATGWPTAVAIMGNWFGENKGLIFGVWSSCASVGNIIGALLCGSVIDMGYEYGFLLPSALLFSGGFVVACGVINEPKDIGFEVPSHPIPEINDAEDTDGLIQTDENNANYQGISIEEKEVEVEEPEHIGCMKALRIPGVVPYALAYAFLKLVNYSFFFWLPYYLNKRYHWSNSVSDELSSYYDLGGIVGGIVAGVISDFMWSRSPITISFLWLSVPVIYFYSISPADQLINVLLMCAMGFFIGGPANVISAAVMADLGKRKSLTGNKAAFAVVTGIVDGTGSVGAGIGQIIVPIMQEKFSWSAMFYLFMALDFGTTIFILPVLINDIRARFGRQNAIVEN